MKRRAIISLMFIAGAAAAQPRELADLRGGIESSIELYYTTWVCAGDTLRTDTTETQGVLTLIDGFWIMCQEVTTNLIRWYGDAVVDSSLLPATGLTAREAGAVCRRFAQSLNREWRLPTREEWLFAYRGGIFSEGYRYSGSDHAWMVGWTRENSGGRLHKGGERIANELGIQDMTGNAAEMVVDGRDTLFMGGSYLEETASDPQLPTSPPLEACGFRLLLHEAIWFDSDNKRVFRMVE